MYNEIAHIYIFIHRILLENRENRYSLMTLIRGFIDFGDKKAIKRQKKLLTLKLFRHYLTSPRLAHLRDEFFHLRHPHVSEHSLARENNRDAVFNVIRTQREVNSWNLLIKSHRDSEPIRFVRRNAVEKQCCQPHSTREQNKNLMSYAR